MKETKKKIGFVVGNYHTDHPGRLVHMIWNLLKDENVQLQVFLGTESASFIQDFALRSSRFDYQYASLCGYTEYENLDLLIISAGTLSIYQNEIPLEEFLRHTPDIPMILTETDRAPKRGITLIADNTQGIAGCVEHLIEVHGLTRIGYITGPKNNQDAEERFIGYRDTLVKHGIPIREEYIVQGDYSENVDRSVEQLLDHAPELEAIVSAYDEMTVAIYRVCRARGLEVGKDIAVTGFDDMLMAGYSKHVEGYSWDEAPVMLRKSGNPAFRFPGNVMTFLLFDEEYQYGVLNVEIEPEKIDFYYMLSLDIGTSLRYMDIWTRQKQYRAQLQAMARTDELTGLYNRAGLISARERLTADRQRPVTVILADLDHLKQINDHFGHREGDIALKSVAKILTQVFGTGQVIGRIGGDEFQACFVQMTEEEIEEKIRSVKAMCQRYNECSERPYFLEISVGYATGIAQTRTDWEALATRADEKLYEAKKTRRGFVIR